MYKWTGNRKEANVKRRPSSALGSPTLDQHVNAITTSVWTIPAVNFNERKSTSNNLYFSTFSHNCSDAVYPMVESCLKACIPRIWVQNSTHYTPIYISMFAQCHWPNNCFETSANFIQTFVVDNYFIHIIIKKTNKKAKKEEIIICSQQQQIKKKKKTENK